MTQFELFFGRNLLCEINTSTIENNSMYRENCNYFDIKPVSVHKIPSTRHSWCAFLNAGNYFRYSFLFHWTETAATTKIP